MSSNTTRVNLNISKSGLSNLLSDYYATQTNRQFIADGITFTLLPAEGQPVRISASGKDITVDSSVRFSFTRPAGLFSVEGDGHIRLGLNIHAEITSDFNLSTKTSLTNHEWLQGPVIHIGEMDFPAETLTNCVIKYYKETILDKIDGYVEQQFHLREILKTQLAEKASNVLINRKPDLFFSGSLHKIRSGYFSETETDIFLPMDVEAGLLVSDKAHSAIAESEPIFEWMDASSDFDGSQPVDVLMSYEGLAKMIKTGLQSREIGGKKFEVSDVHIRFTSRLEVSVRLAEPIKGTLTITGLPRIEHESQQLHLDDLKTDVNADNFIYKLSSPIIENIITGKINEMLPVNLQKLILPYLKMIPSTSLMEGKISVQPSVDNMILDSLRFEQQQVSARIMAIQSCLDVNVKGALTHAS